MAGVAAGEVYAKAVEEKVPRPSSWPSRCASSASRWASRHMSLLGAYCPRHPGRTAGA
uniref:Uncharacterized protein n=1 Tax=Macrostomum lignano TaxID=282301 RepID=A0A1I8FNF6_9PLAT